MEVPRELRHAPGIEWLLLAGAFALLTALSIIALDVPLARGLAAYEPWSGWDRGITLLEWVILLPLHPLTAPIAGCVAMIACVVTPRWRVHAPPWMFAASVHLLARFLAVHLKTATGRLRPNDWLHTLGPTFGRAGISFPSGHVALFGSLAAVLAVLHPRLRVPMAIVIGLVATARVAVGAHFLSDTLGAIALVALLVWACGQATRPLRPH